MTTMTTNRWSAKTSMPRPQVCESPPPPADQPYLEVELTRFTTPFDGYDVDVKPVNKDLDTNSDVEIIVEVGHGSTNAVSPIKNLTVYMFTWDLTVPPPSTFIRIKATWEDGRKSTYFATVIP
jgi:hypothetical protein